MYSPHVARLDLWKTSGHVEYYRENMFAPMQVEGSDYQLKPMNCPFHIMIYKSHLRSYRDLPIRYGGAGHGLPLRAHRRAPRLAARARLHAGRCASVLPPGSDRSRSQPGAGLHVLRARTFGFTEFEVYLSTRPRKNRSAPTRTGTLATSALEAALKSRGVAYQLDPGEGVFYGPKIDIKIKDVLGRSWQCSTVQVDFNNPERFDWHIRERTASRTSRS